MRLVVVLGLCVWVCDDALSRWMMGSGENGSETGRVASLHIVIMYGKQREIHRFVRSVRVWVCQSLLNTLVPLKKSLPAKNAQTSSEHISASHQQTHNTHRHY